MPSRAKQIDRAVANLASIPKDRVNQFLTGPMRGEAINAASLAFKQALIEASLNAELTDHLGYAPGAEKPAAATNQRNGSTSKTVLSGDGSMRVATPRDRDGSFEPVLLPKHARRFTAFDDCIVALYARGLTVREIQGYLAEAYGTEVGHDLISTVTDGVLTEVSGWQARPLEPVYPVVFFDAIRVKLREDNVVRNKAVYLAQALRPIYAAVSAEAAEAALDAFAEGDWGRKFPTVVAAWRRAWTQVIPFFAFPPAIRRVIYTTNAIESVNAQVRKIIKTRGHFPTDDAASKLIWLALRNITADWGRPAHHWKEAMNQFAILYDDRLNLAA
jgi:transposase-like protein